MNMHVQDPFDAIEKRGGYTEAFLAKQKAHQQAEAERLRVASERKKAIDALRKTGCPEWVRNVILDTADRHGMDPMEVLLSWKRCAVPVRDEALYAIKAERPSLSSTRIAKWLGRDHSTILASWARHAAKNGLPSFTKLDHERRRNIWRTAQAKARARSGEKAGAA